MRERHLSRQFLPLMLCILFFNQLSAQCSLEDRYWTIRKRLNEHFVKNDYESLKNGYDDLDGIGLPMKDAKGNFIMPIRYSSAGFGMPSESYNMATNSVTPGGDATAAQGNYFAMLATEWKLLKNTGDDKNAKKTLDELFLALQAVRRLDKEANQFMLEEGKKQGLPKLVQSIEDGKLQYDEDGKPIVISVQGPCSDPAHLNNNIDMSGYSGFFYRTDMPWGFDKPENTASYWDGPGAGSLLGIQHNYDANNGEWNPNWHEDKKNKRVGTFSSVDQIYGLLYGLGVAKTMLMPVSTPEEIKVVETIDKMMVGLIAQGMSNLKLIGCFEDAAKIQGSWARPFQNKLYDIAKQFGLDDEVDKIVPKEDLKNIISGIFSFDDVYKGGCIPNNSFQVNNYLRLFSINPQDNVKTPVIGIIDIPGMIIGATQNDLVVVGSITANKQKYSYGLSAALVNGCEDGDNKINKVLNNNCEGMKAKLATAPCCGPNIWVTNAPKVNPATTTAEMDWLGGDSNDGGIECPNMPHWLWKEEEKFGYNYEPQVFNGVDYLLDYNLMLLACEQEVKGSNWHLPNTPPKLVQPDPLKSSAGCEDDKFFLHINGPDEVCAGTDVIFSLSTADGKTPYSDGKWTGSNKNTKTVSQIKTADEGEKAKFMHNFTDKIPTNLATGSTFTVTYNFTIWPPEGTPNPTTPPTPVVPTNKSISKTVKVVNKKPTTPVIQSKTEDKCNFTITYSCSECSGGTATQTYKKSDLPLDEKITLTNACGNSGTLVVTIPPRGAGCKNDGPSHGKAQNDENANIDFKINFDAYSNFITTTTDRIYYKAFDCRLIDIQGRTISSKKYTDSNISLDVSELDLLSGMYIFQIITNDGLVWSKKSSIQLNNYEE